MAELFTAYRDKTDNRLICGCCGWLMRNPKVLVVNATAKLVQCKHCWKLNKVKLT